MNSAADKSIDGWKLLLKNAAPNALHDSDARYDPPKCDEDTRVEVTGEIMDWMMDCNGPQRLLCMTGAAGSGKSALQQTTAEKCLENGILACTFFFSASDPTRNTVKPVIPTIAYQLGRASDLLRRCIKAAVENDPLIFSKSLRTPETGSILFKETMLPAPTAFNVNLKMLKSRFKVLRSSSEQSASTQLRYTNL
ncbi:hypothetical protein EST38_g6440 [Candolleomyces aberdarensis]|uniref:Nephrocystin 3-like N-terminal domain-containing protein n=1 Tax=Candolleomyces aberdarensis TaxID=2316362 RepID=A0A4Q2DI37_9AGAR|nr:hypothetical protein EST38_g6440 [Candolleomyces aberdarensis]